MNHRQMKKRLSARRHPYLIIPNIETGIAPIHKMSLRKEWKNDIKPITQKEVADFMKSLEKELKGILKK